MPGKGGDRGFSLLEALVALVLAGILALAAATAGREAVRAARLTATRGRIVMALARARQRALTEHRTLFVRFELAGSRLVALSVLRDDGSGQLDGSDELLATVRFPADSVELDGAQALFPLGGQGVGIAIADDGTVRNPATGERAGTAFQLRLPGAVIRRVATVAVSALGTTTGHVERL